MKNVIKFICSFVCYLAFVPSILLLTLGLTWYVLPSFQTTQFGQLLLDFIGDEQQIFIYTMGILSCTLFFGIMGKVFVVIKNSKALNFYTHLITWLVAIVLSLESLYSFLLSNAIQSTSIELGMIRKIGIVACSVALILYAILSPKIRVLVNRRIQAYDTAKELNANGRSSVVGMQILKTFDFICPELFLLIALCFAFDFSISLYFIFIICSFILPIIGNMICDKRVKVECERKKVEEREVLVSEIANAINSMPPHQE